MGNAKWMCKNPCDGCGFNPITYGYSYKCTSTGGCKSYIRYESAVEAQRKLLQHLIDVPDGKCIILTVDNISKGAISKFTLEGMLKILESDNAQK